MFNGLRGGGRGSGVDSLRVEEFYYSVVQGSEIGIEDELRVLGGLRGFTDGVIIVLSVRIIEVTIVGICLGSGFRILRTKSGLGYSGWGVLRGLRTRKILPSLVMI